MVATAIFFVRKRNPGLFTSSPAIITTTGIACTFIGITAGLYGFNSVRDLAILLNGLKTAFIPSTIAVLISIVFKFLTSKSSEAKYATLFQELVNSNKLIAEILAQQYPLKYKTETVETISENELRKKLIATTFIIANEDLAVFIKYSLGIGANPSLTYKLKGDQLAESIRIATGLDIPVIKGTEIAEKIYHKYEPTDIIPIQFMEPIFELAQKNEPFLVSFDKQFTDLIEVKGSFVLISNNSKLAVLLNCSKESLPIVLFIAQDNMAKNLIKEATKLKLPVIKGRKVVNKIKKVGKSGDFLPKALVPEIGAIVGDNYAVIEPFFKGNPQLTN